MGPLSIHAALALRHPPTNTPTLLSPLRSIANTPNITTADAPDDFQSNAWVHPRPPLTGLGITYLRDTTTNLYDQPFDLQDPVWPMQVDCEGSLSFSAGYRTADVPLDDFSTMSPLRQRDRRRAQCTLTSFCDEYDDPVELGLDPDIDFPASDIIGLIPDVNMYDKLRRQDLSHTGVNPLDTISTTSLHEFVVRNGEPALLTLKGRNMDDSPSGTDRIPEPSPSPRVIQDIMSILVQPTSNFSFLPWPHSDSPSAPPQLAAPGSPTSINLEPVHVPGRGPHPLTPAHNFEYPDTNRPSPVLNAHLGIELGELISRAERFRNKYPDRDIDRTWLSHFAGKLSDRGELLDDFRCYVIGCDQRNKRRDHILVHVGAHIGQRPFACSLCSLRFLRKNECKRHEASHSGFRPYSCDICGQTFVRQDLVKRHVKRTHGPKDENRSGTTKPRKKARLV